MAGLDTDADRDRYYSLALRLAPGVGPRRFAQLVGIFGTAEAVLSAPVGELARVPRLPGRIAEVLARFDWRERVESELDRVREWGCRLMILGDADYPGRLKEIHAPPPVLWVSGDIRPEDEAAVAIVGSRGATDYGRDTARRLAVELAEAGVTVVSGLAIGIDAAAHRGALEAGGRTFAVLGCGLDVVYPRPNVDLHHQVPRAGALISEFPMATSPEPGHFPVRNRVIAGLSIAVVVVEAAERSGALITARLALEENRDVLAVPGRVGSIKSRGTHALLKQGARLVETGRDVIEEVAPQLAGRLGKPRTPVGAGVRMDADEERVWLVLNDEPLHIDPLCRKLGLSPSRLAPMLLSLELKGLVKQLPGTRYIRMN
ncbi:MAG: DNA-processing protein DprA [Proteobacteria bacterium]|nr:DNA-processing protein DprA [Pseudomonadota bacterium]